MARTRSDRGGWWCRRRGADLGRCTLPRLSDVAGKQLAALRGNEDRLRQYLRDQEVPLAEAA